MLNQKNILNIMPGKTLFVFLVLHFAYYSTAQEFPATEEKLEEEYQKRIQQEYLNGVYIPKDLTDCFVQINRLTDDASKSKFKNMPEEDAAHKLHFSLGRWIIYNWGFYGGSRLSYYLSNLGIGNPDDMAQFIIITYHRNLNKNKLEVKALIDHYQAKREAEKKKRLEEGEIIHEETRKRQH